MFLLRFFRSLPRIAAGKMYVLLRFLRVSVENSREAMCFLVGSRSDCGMIFFCSRFAPSWLLGWCHFLRGRKRRIQCHHFFLRGGCLLRKENARGSFSYQPNREFGRWISVFKFVYEKKDKQLLYLCECWFYGFKTLKQIFG